MDKKSLRRAIEKRGEFLNITQVSELLGMDRDVVKRDFLNGLDYIQTGKAKLYFKEDIINAIMDKVCR